LGSFTDAAVARPEAQALLSRLEVREAAGSGDLLAGTVEVELRTRTGAVLSAAVEVPPGAPGRPPTEAELADKIGDCAGGQADAVAGLTWDVAASRGPALVDAGR